MANPHFHPPVEPYATGSFAVDPPHVLYFEEVGNPDGIPVLFVHGGPGAGCSEFDRRFFDAGAFRVVLVDQRGAGRSTPYGELSANDPDHLVADFELLRERLGIERWHLFGGSWGSTLALHYAQTHPERVLSMVLRGTWLMREEEVRWWLYDLGKVHPELWDAFAGRIPEEERGDLLEAYWRRLTGPDREEAHAAARAWSTYESSACTLLPNPEFAGMFDDADKAWSLARLEVHFTRNVRLKPDGVLLDRMDRIRHVPAFAVHGRYDVICPAKNLHDLRAAWAELDAVFVPGAGHSSHEPGITRELVAATRRIAETGSPVRSSGDRGRPGTGPGAPARPEAAPPGGASPPQP
jgi:proline iminopeptidase